MEKSIKYAISQGITVRANLIIGFPYETRELAFDTIRLNKTFGAPEIVDNNSYPFTPFTGTPLRKLCEELGYVKETDIVNSVMSQGSLLNMPQFSGEEVDGLTKTFNMYVKFPEDRWDEIRIAEKNTKEGNKKFNELKDEFIETFWKDGIPLPDFHDLHASFN